MANKSALIAIVLLSCALALAVANNNLHIEKKLIDGPLEDIQWADLNTVFVVSENGHLYRSANSGKTWTKQTQMAEDVRQILINSADPRKVFVMGRSQSNWFSTDMGKTWQSGEKINLHEAKMHPRQSSWLLGADMSPGCSAKNTNRGCYKRMHYSKDLGKTWTLAVKYVVQFEWNPLPIRKKNTKKTPTHDSVLKKPYKDPEVTSADKLVWAAIHTQKSGNQRFGVWDKDTHFFKSYDMFKTSVEVVAHGNRFLFGTGSYLFVAAVNPHRETEVSLAVSKDVGENKRFATAILPVDLTEHSYTILDASEGAVFLHVNHAPFHKNAPTGHVYVSDWSGTKYALSLPYNHRSPDGKCDFEKVEGLEGIYLANFIDEDTQDDDSENSLGNGATSKTERKRMRPKTVITFDKGGIWSYLAPPQKDSNGDAYPCLKSSDSSNCHLHLHGITDLYGPFYSTASATGLIMSTGTVGKYLQESNTRINTFLSRDAGLTWFEVAKGSHIYEFGDHGGLIVMAYDEGETDSIQYSWDEGHTWQSLKISSKPMQIENIIIEPQGTALTFIVYGWQSSSGVLIYIDFTELHQRKCHGLDDAGSAASDYEEWTPSDGRLDGKCLLGHKVSYTRRKRDSKCYNPEEHQRNVFKEHCVCTAEDFECDYGYYRKVRNGPCVKDPDAEPLPQEKCTDFYYVSKGYRRVAGDTCTSGAQWDRTQIPCPSWTGSHTGKLVLIIICIIVVALAVVTFYSGSSVFEWFDAIRAKFGKSDYNIVGGGMVPNSAIDDDFGLDDSEFGQSAQLIGDEDMSHLEDLKPLPEISRRQNVPALDKPPVDNDF